MIGVFGGTGNTGGQVVAALKAKGTDFTCIVRDPGAAKAKLGDDVKVVQGDLSDPSSLDGALEGAKRAGVSYIVEASGSEKGITPDSPSQIMQMHYQVENKVRDSGIKWAISRPNFFMSNLMGMAEPVAKMGKLISALPLDTVISMIHPADIGESVAELLTNQERAGREYFLAGPAITMGDVVKGISDAVGKEIEYVQVPPEAARGAMEEKGMPDWLIAHMGAMMGICGRGDMADETDWVQQLTGHAPRTLSEWLGGAKAAFGG